MTEALQSIEAVGGSLTGATLTLHQAARSYLRWLESRHTPVNTLQSYGHGLSLFLTFAAGAKIRTPADVTVLAVEGFFLWLKEQRAAGASTVSHRRSVLVNFWKWLDHEGFADRNVPAKTYTIKVSKRLPVYLEPHQIDEFLRKLAALGDDPLARRDYAMVATFFYSGLRVGELVALRLSSVDLVARRIKILHGKGDRDRTIVLPPRLTPILSAYLTETRPALVRRPMGRVYRLQRGPHWQMEFWQDGRRVHRTTGVTTEDEARRVLAEHAPQPTDSGYLFVNAGARNGHRLARDGQPLLARSVYAIIRRRAHQFLGVKLAPHKLRHTCASYLLLHGASLETIQRHLGHADLKTTMIYLHVPQKRQDDEISKAFA